jgi:hypothetical protein
MLKTILILLILPLQSFASNKIVGGFIPEDSHPAKFNTVALIKASNKKVFCTGSLISKTMILTAKHCLVDKKPEDVLVFFGDDTNKLDQGIVRPVSLMKARRPKDWQMTFPSFDVAWIQLTEDAPSDYRPLPILSLKEELPVAPIHLAGHGNSSPINGKIEAGAKFITTTNLKTYYDNSRFFHILLFEGEEGRGACYGDSGGPAYIKTKNGWAIIGVTNGFDIVLTPKAMRRSNDEDFPYRIDCKKNQILYSFAGAHGAWIESSSKQSVLKTSEFKESSIDETSEVTSILEWCSRRDYGSPEWNFLKLLLDQKVDSMNLDEAEAFYNNCNEVETYLSSLRKLRINGEKTIDASYSLAPLHLLDLDILKIFNSNIDQYSFESDKKIKIKKLSLYKVNLESLGSLNLSQLTLDSLSLDNNPLTSLKGLEELTGLRALSLYRTKVQDFTPLLNFKELEELDISATPLKSTDILKAFKLRKLSIGSPNLEDLSLKGQDKLESITINSTNLFTPELLIETPNLKEANLAYLKIKDLSVFSKFDFLKLEKLNLTGNPVVNLTSLVNLKGLLKLRLFGTPLARKEVIKTPENCPRLGPEVLIKFCSTP